MTEIAFTLGVLALGIELVGFESFIAFYLSVFGKAEAFFCAGMSFKLCVHFCVPPDKSLQKANIKRTYFGDLEEITTTMLLPSSFGCLSTEPTSAQPSINFWIIVAPSSG